MVLRSLLVSLFLCVASGAMPQAAAPSAVPHESNPADAFKQAKRSLAQGQLDQALSEAKLGLARAPRSVVGLNLLGVIYNQEGKYEEAAMQFQQALAIAPNSVETLVNLANSLAAQNKPELAELTLKKALRIQPGSKTADYNLAALLLGQNKAKEALTYLLRIPSPDQTTRLMVVRAYLDAGMLATGMAAAEKLSKDFAKDTRVHFSLGVLLASHRQYRESAYEFEKADALQPGDFDILHDLGEAYLLSGQLPKAQESLNQALRSKPDSADTLYLLAETSAGMHREVDALELLVRARKVAPNNTNMLFLMAQLSMKQSFFEDAIEVLNDGLRIDAKRADFHAALGESYFTIGKVDKALGKFDEAKRYLRQSLSADPNNIPALFNLGFIARKEGNNLQADQYLQRAVRLGKDYPEALFELGSLRMDQKKYDEAVPLFRHFVEVTENPTQGYYKLAISERNLHQLEA